MLIGLIGASVRLVSSSPGSQLARRYRVITPRRAAPSLKVEGCKHAGCCCAPTIARVRRLPEEGPWQWEPVSTTSRQQGEQG